MSTLRHLPNSRLADTLEACLLPLEGEGTRDMVSLGLSGAVETLLGRGWQAKLRPASVLVGVRRVWPEPRVIFTVRTRQLRAHAGQISFPGGRADPGDRFPLGTALREAEEEVGLRAAQIRALGCLEDYPTVSRYRVTPVVAWVEEDAHTQAQESEVAEIFEVPLRGLLEPARYTRTWMAKFGLPVYEYHHGPYRIWGATAGMLWNLQERFHATLAA